ncbi:HPr family phosphocarrier protein, partial [Anaerostipes sp.]
ACIKCGSEIELVCEGPDEEAALAHATELIESGLGE